MTLEPNEFFRRLSKLEPTRILLGVSGPKSQITIDFAENQALQAICNIQQCLLSEIQAVQRRFDLVILIVTASNPSDLIEDDQTNAKNLTLAIAHAKNILAENVWLLWRPAEALPLSATSLLGLGFSRNPDIQLDGDPYHHYQYQLRDYIRTKSWNNSKYWANPENWGKFRW